jgi:predicted transporter
MSKNLIIVGMGPGLGLGFAEKLGAKAMSIAQCFGLANEHRSVAIQILNYLPRPFHHRP